jgi:hypothetical protein
MKSAKKKAHLAVGAMPKGKQWGGKTKGGKKVKNLAKLTSHK